ncbi:NAD(P)/FAD-dependent oxidoreductase [Amycolatopsis keratiniphila]|uniref:NAD(P)/FAD-dependent oxidoreductase n=1 Tax=Amycolatopsis keratiniphila TaxID=129921 RepID=UPI003405D02A
MSQVLVVGAGPAGSVAAAVLAGSGMRVLVARRRSHPIPNHDLLLGKPARELLRSIGVAVDRWPVLPVSLAVSDQTARPVPDAGYSLVDRDELCGTLREHAAGLGAEYVPDKTDRPGGHIILAGGVGHLRGRTPHSTGLTVVQRFIGAEPDGRVLLRMLAPPADEPRGHPRCAWLAPAPGGYAVGATAFGDVTPEALLDEAFAALSECEPALANLRAAGPAVTGPLHAGFGPGVAVDEAGLRVGDAAGLVNPFTGEGLSHAMQSGQLAARAILARPDDPEDAAREYSRLLDSTYVGYFETARHVSSRYHLAWRVLNAGTSSESPFFAKSRRAIVLSEAVPTLTTPESMTVPVGLRPAILPFLAACDEVSVATVRREWPFLARMFTAPVDDLRPRPALGFFGAMLAGGQVPARGHATVAAAIEIATLGVLAFLGPAAAPREVRGVDWESATTVLAGDHLVGRASRLIAQAKPEILWTFSDWITELAALRATAATSGSGAGTVFSSLFEFPLRVGSHLGDAPSEPLRAYGEALGRVFLHAEDVLALRGNRTRLDVTLAGLLAGRISALPELLSIPDLTASSLTGSRLATASAAAAEEGERARKTAADALTQVENPSARRLLGCLLDSIAAPLSSNSAVDS